MQTIEYKNREVLLSRARGLSVLRQRLGVATGLDSIGDEIYREVMEADISEDGRIAGIWLFSRDKALGSVDAKRDFDASVRRFIVENLAIYDLEGSDVVNATDVDWLGVPTVVASLHMGKEIVRVAYRPTYRNFVIADGHVNAVFIDGRMVSLIGTVINPAEEFDGIGDIAVSESTAKYLAELSAMSIRQGNFNADLRSPVASIAQRRMVYSMSAEQITDFGSRDKRIKLDVVIDASSGEVLNVGEVVAPSPGQYKVMSPTNYDTTIQAQTGVPVTVTGEVYTAVGPYFMWKDLSNKTDVFSFTTKTLNGGQFYTWTNPSGVPDFTATSGTRLAQQHSAYWTQQAAQWSESGFDWLPTLYPASQYLAVNVIAQSADITQFKSSNCPATAPDAYDLNACILLKDLPYNATPYAYNLGPSTSGVLFIDSMYHEVGHFIDWKYRAPEPSRLDNLFTAPCNGGTSEEGTSVSETFAQLYALSAISARFWPTTPFVDLDGAQGSLARVSGGDPSNSAHVSTSTLSCYKTTNSCGNPTTTDPSRYTYGNATVQAFWESFHGKNCFNQPCYTTNNPSQHTYNAGWNAFQWAVAVTPQNATHVALAANILGYYWNFTDYNSWSDRWWIFNHHNLVGPPYGYSSCHL